MTALALLWSGCGSATEDLVETTDAAGARAGDVRTMQGTLRGVMAGGTWAWRGIPYAKPPLGSLRFSPPEAFEPWTGVRDASLFGAACAQVDESGFIGSEDCLTLNVWAPADYRGAALPVLFFIHGGGHQQGSSSQELVPGTPIYDGQRFVESAPVVLVTINYRLGPFGFLAHPALSAEGPEKSGNYGMLDQLAALRWVHDNIAGFGGDPARVVVFGESAGAVSTCRVVASPEAHGLLSGAIMESGACRTTALADAEARGLAVAEEVGCGSSRDAARCLRRVSAATLLATVPSLDLGSGFSNTYDGVYGGRALPRSSLDMIAAGRHNAVPMILGTNTEELGKDAPAITTEAEYRQAVAQYAASIGRPTVTPQLLAIYPSSDYASPRAAYVAMTSDIKFRCPTRKAIRTLVGVQSAPVYEYSFSHVADLASSRVKQLGATHGTELPFVFGTLPRQGAGDEAVVALFNAAWSNFAASSSPNPVPGVTWRPYHLDREAFLTIDAPPSAGAHHRSEQCGQLEALGE